jgi:chromosome segregation ATPase
MTPTKFFIARVAQAFGINRKSKRMSDAANEMHLLRDAETVLGAAVWEHVEKIEELSVEYWNLRRLVKERDEIRAKVASCNEKLELAHNDRAELLNSQAEPHHELMAQRQAIMAKLETVARDRDAVVARAREVRRAYEGMKMKLEVIGKESSEDHPELTTVREKLEDLKLKFNELKLLRAKVAKELEEGDAELDKLDAELARLRKERRDQASKAFQVIGEANRDISTHRAELGLIETQISQLYSEIGRYVSRNRHRNPACAEASKEHHSLVDVMRCLRSSVSMNHRLSGQS